MKPEGTVNIISFLPMVFSIASIIFSIVTFVALKRRTYYSSLDSYYNSLLRDALANPEFRDLSFTSKYEPLNESNDLPEEKRKKIKQYEIYAFMCWNFCETVYDYCIRNRDTHLMTTWNCIIESENKLHRKWFFSDENKKNFKRGFQKHVESIGDSKQQNTLVSR